MQPALTFCGTILESGMSMMLAPHPHSPFSSSLRSPNPTSYPFSAAFLARGKNTHLLAYQLTSPLLRGLAEKGTSPAYLGEVFGIPRERGL
jgi:hypothetical protein